MSKNKTKYKELLFGLVHELDRIKDNMCTEELNEEWVTEMLKLREKAKSNFLGYFKDKDAKPDKE